MDIWDFYFVVFLFTPFVVEIFRLNFFGSHKFLFTNKFLQYPTGNIQLEIELIIWNLIHTFVKPRHQTRYFLDWMHFWITHTKVHWALFLWLILFSSIVISQIILLKLHCGESTNKRWGQNKPQCWHHNVYKSKVNVRLNRQCVTSKIRGVARNFFEASRQNQWTFMFLRC